MARDAEDTKRRLLAAAAAEFAERGIAGARIDRIAAQAAANKALIYTYFGNKEELFDAVFNALVVDTVHDVPIDADDLVSYAGQLFDRNISHPQALRLAIWHSLQRGGAALPDAVVEREPGQGRGDPGGAGAQGGERPVPGGRTDGPDHRAGGARRLGSRDHQRHRCGSAAPDGHRGRPNSHRGGRRMKVIIFGATGMVGQGVLRESLLAADVEQVLCVGRRPTGVKHPKLREVTLADFTDLTPIADELAGYDACFYCLGVSSVGMDEAAYTRISYDFPIAAARTLAKLNPDLTFVYVSGAGTNPTGRQMWQRVKGRTENAVIEMFPNGYAVRPGIIRPTHGVAVQGRLVQHRLHGGRPVAVAARPGRAEVRDQHRPARPRHAPARPARPRRPHGGEPGPAVR